MSVRSAAVAGSFYPADPDELTRMVEDLVGAAEECDAPKALIAPHAGYVYSGPIAATGYRRLASAGDTIRRVVLMGPAHRYPLRGVAAHSADEFATPLGRVAVDPVACGLQGVRVLDDAHAGEHSLEVHLPFLQVALDEFVLVPLVVGDAGPGAVADVLEAAWGGPETLVVVSSDLSHYHDDETARRADRATADAILERRAEEIGPRQACGCRAVAGLLEVARRKDLSVELLDLRNSSDTAGGRDRVVGYGTFAVN